MLYDTIVEFYRENEIMAAKQILVQRGEFTNCQSIISHMKKRIGENKAERSVDDILSLFTYLDENDARNRLPLFCAATLSRVLVIADEMSDMEIVKKELATVKQQVSVIVDKNVNSNYNNIFICSSKFTQCGSTTDCSHRS